MHASLSPIQVVGRQAEALGDGESWPVDLPCDGGIIHAIDTVLVPGAAAEAADAAESGPQVSSAEEEAKRAWLARQQDSSS